MTDIAAALATIEVQIAGRAHLIAVSKTQPVEAIRAALAAGQRRFGENRVQEAAAKFPDLRPLYPDLELHLIGPLQTNKIRDALGLFDVIQTVDRLKLAEGLAAAVSRGEGRCRRFFIQVNIGEEPQKAGIAPAEADAFIETCRGPLGLPIEGLMAIPPAGVEPSPYFALLRAIAARHGLAQLSMGMSTDYPVALDLGATYIRVGTAIFGARAPVTPAG